MYYFRKVIVATIIVTVFMTTSIPVFALDNQANQVASADMTTVYNEILNSEADWIASLQFADGAIPTYSDPISNYSNKYKVIPYFTHLGLLGLLEKPEYANVVKNYINWYFVNLNENEGLNVPDGSVYDYYYEQDKVSKTPTGDFDSTDSYASTFINLIRKYYEVTGDRALLLDNEESIRLIGSAMLATQQDDGLTWAKPAYKVKYLMDNAEVYKGLVDLEWITLNIFEDAAESERFKQLKEQVFSAVQNSLWLENKGLYSPGMFEDGVLINANWTTFYPDATAQLFPIWTGILEPTSERAINLYNAFNQHHPGWTTLNKDDAFPWVMIAYTAAIMGDKIRVDEFLQTIKSTYIDTEHPWPWYVMESGLAMLTVSEIKNKTVGTIDFSTYFNPNGTIIDSHSFLIEGTSVGLARVEVELVHKLTNQKTNFYAIPNMGEWEVNLQNLVNGDYSIKITTKDTYNNIHHQLTGDVTIDVAGDENEMASVSIQADKATLRRNETVNIDITAFNRDGEQVNLADATIDYIIDQSSHFIQKGPHSFQLVGIPLDESVTTLTIGAYVTKGSVVKQTDTISLLISRDAPTVKDEKLDILSRWIAAKQLNSGEFATNSDKNEINPQLANIALLGLLHRHETVSLVKEYIRNYKLNWTWPDVNGVYGTKYNSQLNEDEWQVTQDYDSAIANLATFISLQRAYYETTGELNYLQSELDIMSGGIGMLAMQDADGLMWSKKAGNTKLLIDNVLGLKGMLDSVWLFENYFKDAGPASYFNSFAESLNNGIDSYLWSSEQNEFYYMISDTGEVTSVNWENWEQAALQLLPIATGKLAKNNEKAVSLYCKFIAAFPDWESSKVLTKEHGLVAYVSTLMGDYERAENSLSTIVEATQEGNLPYDWDISSAGYSILAVTQLQDPILPELEVTSGSAYLGSTATIDIKLKNAAEISSFSFTLQYDPNQLTLLSLESEVWDVIYTGQPGLLNLQVEKKLDVNTEQLIDSITAKFSAVGQAGEHAIYLSDAKGDKKFGLVNMTISQNGKITTLNPTIQDTTIELPISENISEESNTENSEEETTVTYPNFQDVNHHWAKSYIEKALKLGFVKGYTDGTFKADNPVSREEFTTLLGRALNIQQRHANQLFIDDASISTWARGYIHAFKNLGVLNGYGDGSFRANHAMKKIESIVMIMRAFNVELDTAAMGEAVLTEEQIPDWAKAYITKAISLGIIHGDENGKINFNTPISRGEAVTMIIRLIDYQNSKTQ